MDIASVFRAPLFRHDSRIAKNSLRSTLAGRGDQLFVAAVTVVALAALHHLLSGRPLAVVISLALGASALCGLGVAGLVHRRLEFQASDGSLAAQALCPEARRDYSLALHLVSVAPVMIIALIAKPEAMLAAPFGYLAGALAGHGVRAILPTGDVRAKGRMPLGVQAFLNRPVSGAVVGGLLCLTLPLLGEFDPVRGAVFAGIMVGVAALALTTVDDAVVRFMTLSGYTAERIVWLQARPLLLCLALSLPAALVLSLSLAALAMAGVGVAALVLMAARILAYRVHGRRVADVVLGLCVAVCGVVGLTFPPALPLVGLAVLGVLARRSIPATWRLS